MKLSELKTLIASIESVCDAHNIDDPLITFYSSEVVEDFQDMQLASIQEYSIAEILKYCYDRGNNQLKLRVMEADQYE